MYLPHPKSFLKLLLLGFFIVALPLLVALACAVYFMESLSDQSKHAVYQAVSATQSSRKLVEEIITMERSARQFLVLGDDALHNSYLETHMAFLHTLTEMDQLLLDQSIRENLSYLRDSAGQAYTILHDKNNNSLTMQNAVSEFVFMSEKAKEVLEGSNRIIDREVNIMRDRANEAQSFFMWFGVVLIPALFVVSGGVAIFILKPIRQIEHAIHQLGKGEFTTPIKVTGPLDIEYLGTRLDWLRLRLAEVEDEKIKFLRHVSHELKTPLSSIHEGTELLAEGIVGPMSQEQEEVVNILHTNVEELQTMIENLLTFNGAHQEQPILNLEIISLGTLLKQVVAEQRLSIMAKELEVNADFDPVLVFCDKEKIRVVFDNLLSNAVKYSPRNGVISLQVIQGPDGVRIEFCDNGPGIESTDKDRIFEPFYQGKIMAHGHIKGSGLGLAIVREYVERHGWNIAAAECDGAGTCMSLKIPIGQPKE